VQTRNKNGILSLDFGLREFGVKTAAERLRYYRRFVYEKGSIEGLEKERQQGFEIDGIDRFRYRTRYFTDSGTIGTKAFVSRYYRVFKDHFSSKREKGPKAVAGLSGIYAVKRLCETKG
jgi:hypothetical protein